jgi:hypothetical protein
MASVSASQSTVIAPASSRQNFDLARNGTCARRDLGRFGPAAHVGAGLDMGSVILTSHSALPKRELDLILPEKVVKLGQKHGQLMKNKLPILSINVLILNRKRPRSVLNAV